MPAPPLGKRKRKWAPKVRTGCKTCKRRRKRCDEGKPHCQRCHDDKFTCDGYDAPKTWLFDPSVRRDGGKQPSLTPSSESDDQPLTTPWNDDPSTCKSVALQRHSNAGLDTMLLLLQPSGPWEGGADQMSIRYFLGRTAPLLSTTHRWRHFWNSVVPQAAWDHPSVHHAMVAIAATYESSLSGSDRTDIIWRRRHLAVRAFTTAPSVSRDLGLVMCRLFASMAQFQQDWASAAVHMRSGEKILREATHNGEPPSPIARLMAPTFLGLSAADTDDDSIVDKFPPDKRSDFADLRTLGRSYARFLRALVKRGEHVMETSTIGLVSLAFTTMNQAVGSAMYPDVLHFTAHDPVRPPAQIRVDLAKMGGLLSLDELKSASVTLFHDFESFFRAPHTPTDRVQLVSLKQRLKLFVDNYVVRVWEVEPRTTAGTFWLDDEGMAGCSVHEHFHRPQLGITTPRLGAGVTTGNLKDDVTREHREFYHEHVCQYRSGFMC